MTENRDPSSEQREDAALRWLQARRRPVMSTAAQAEFEAWLADPANRAALEEAERLWGEIEPLRPHYQRETAPAAHDRRGALGRIAASVAGIAVLGAGGYALLGGAVQSSTEATGIGEQRTLNLADGSVLNLDAMTRVRVRLSAARRELVVEEGRIDIAVAHDKDRPFFVQAGTRRVRVIGTQFTVAFLGGNAELAVREGIVALSRADSGGGASWAGDQFTLRAGEAANWTATSLTPVHAVPLDRIGEWRQRILSFDRASLREIAQQLGRYYPGRFDIDPQLAGERLTLRLEILDRERTLSLLAGLVGADVQSTADGVRLSPQVRKTRTRP